MTIKNIKDTLLQNLINIPGWRTIRKIVIFESDDWGSIRMPSRDVYELLLNKGIRIDNWSYNRYDSLASEADLTALFEVLQSVHDKNGHSAVITANTIVANPDFDKIRASNFREYHYEPFTETLKRYPEHHKSFELWQEGIRAGIFRPQFHGREHLNVYSWLNALKQNVGHIRLAFDYRLFDLSTQSAISENSFMQALYCKSADELEFQKHAIIEGLQLFEQIFGYKSKTFIPPCYTYSNELNEIFKNQNVNAFQGGWFHLDPVADNAFKLKKHIHYLGQRNRLKQVYLIRNVAFEPTENPGVDWINKALNQIESGFRMFKPAIISTHRINFIGFIDRSNRERNLALFNELLKKIVQKWPDIEFMSSDQLADIILKSQKPNQ